NKDIMTTDVLPLGGSLIPTSIKLGTIHVDPFFSSLNASSGGTLATSSENRSVFGAQLDLLGAISAAFSLPINPFDINATIPDTPISVRVQTLSLLPHLD